METTSTISYLRPKGTFSEMAANKFANKLSEKTMLIDLPSLESVALAVSNGKSDFGVMATYNYLEGLVQECLDLIYENDLKIVGMERIPIEFSTGIYPNSNDFDNVYSHPKGLAQCSEYLQKNYPNSNQISTSSTAEAAKIVNEKKAGLAIAHINALNSNGLDVIGTDVGNRRHGVQNHTDFYVVVKRHNLDCEGINQSESNIMTMIAVTPQEDKVGLLSKILQPIEFYHLNIGKIHSRPALDEVKMSNGGEAQMFYLEIMDHQESDAFKRSIDAIKWILKPEKQTNGAQVLRILGSYNLPGC